MEKVRYQWLDCRTGLSFWAMWYKALIAFMLNKGGFLSAKVEEEETIKQLPARFSLRVYFSEYYNNFMLHHSRNSCNINNPEYLSKKSCEMVFGDFLRWILFLVYRWKLNFVSINAWVYSIYLPSSMQVMPSDHTSTFPSYCPSSMARITSGAILETKRWLEKKQVIASFSKKSTTKWFKLY